MAPDLDGLGLAIDWITGSTEFYSRFHHYRLTWSEQWELNAWQNQMILFLLIAFCIFYAATKKISFFEVIHPRLDKEAFDMYDRYILKKA